MEFPEEKDVYGIEGQFMLGDSLMIAPVLTKTTSHPIYFPVGTWYSYKLYPSGLSGMKMMGPVGANVGVTLSSRPGRSGSFAVMNSFSDIVAFPVFQRGGTIVIRRERARRSTHQSLKDPLTMVIALQAGLLRKDNQLHTSLISKRWND